VCVCVLVPTPVVHCKWSVHFRDMHTICVYNILLLIKQVNYIRIMYTSSMYISINAILIVQCTH